VGVGTAPVLRPPIGQDTAQRECGGIKEGHHLVIEQLSGGQRGLAVVELGKGHFAVGLNEGLLIDPPDALERPDLERSLRPTIARTFALELPMGFFVHLGLL
jgi:hypothetical protein